MQFSLLRPSEFGNFSHQDSGAAAAAVATAVDSVRQRPTEARPRGGHASTKHEPATRMADNKQRAVRSPVGCRAAVGKIHKDNARACSRSHAL
jgi:hypothetical protein